MSFGNPTPIAPERSLTSARLRPLIPSKARSHLAFAGLISRSRGLKERTRVAEVYASVFAVPALRAALLERLQSEKASERLVAALALGTQGNAEAVAPLSVALLDTRRKVRQAAARSLGEIGGVAAGNALFSALSACDCPETRRSILRALWRIAAPDERGRLVQRCLDDDVEAQLSTLAVLSQNPCARTVPLARELIFAADARVRSISILILERAGDASDLQALRALLDDENARVRSAAKDAILRIESGIA